MFGRLVARRRRAAARRGDQRTMTLRPGRDVLSAETPEGAVLLDLKREVFFGLDEAGSVIWRDIAAGGTRAGIAQRLGDEYEVPASVAQADIDRFVQELLDRGLVVEQ